MSIQPAGSWARPVCWKSFAPTSAAGADGFAAEIAARLAERSAGCPVADDASLIVIQHTATRPPRLSVGRSLRALTKMIGLSRV